MPSLRFCSRIGSWSKYLFFFFNDTATTEIYTLSLHDALPIYLRRRPGKGRLAGEHLIEHATEAVDVAPAVELLPGRLFWAHIGDCPHGHAGFREFGAFGRMQCSSDPEIGHNRLPVFEQYVLRLDVPMNDLMPMGVVERAGDSCGKPDGFVHR